MIENSSYVQSELAYRRNRLRSGIAGPRRVRSPFVRRPADASERARR
jgi:hypothetical protein